MSAPQIRVYLLVPYEEVWNIRSQGAIFDSKYQHWYILLTEEEIKKGNHILYKYRRDIF